MVKKKFKQFLALVIAAVMFAGSLPVSAASADYEPAAVADEAATEEFGVSFNSNFAQVGEALSVTVTGASGVTYKWLVDGTQVSTEASYTPTENDLEAWIEVIVNDGTNEASTKLYCSKLPVVYIDTEGGVAITSKENYIDATIKIQGNAQYNESKVLYEGATEIRGRGNSTWAQPKKPYRLKLDKKADVFGMGKSKHWVLLANYLDESLMRNTLAYDLSGELGMEHLSTVWVDVIMNGEYVGNYQFCENIRVDDNRIDIFDWESFAEDAAAVIAEAAGMDEDTAGDLEGYMAEESMQWITSGSFEFNGTTYKLSDYESGLLTLIEEDYGYIFEGISELSSLITGGYILELDEYYDEVSKFKTNSNQPIMFKNPEFVYTNTDMFGYVQNYVQAFEDAVESYDYTVEYDGKTVHYSELYDFDELIDYWLVTEIFFNEEINKKSTYMYKGVGELMKMGPIWDMDWAAGAPGTSTGSMNQWATNYFNTNAQANQWYKYLVQDPYFLMNAQERYWEIRNIQVQGMLDIIDMHYSYLKESGEADGERWSGRRSFHDDATSLQYWLETHVAWMDEQMATEDSFVAGFFAQSSDLELTLSAKDGSALGVDSDVNAPADVITAVDSDLVLNISNNGYVTGTAEIFVNGQKTGNVTLNGSNASYEVSAALLDEAVETKNVIEVKVKDSSDKVVAENYITVKESNCVHSYGEEWKNNEESHWKECVNNCGKTTGLANHTFEWKIDRDATEELNGLKHEECTVCGYKRSENTEFEYVEAPADPSDSSKDIPVEDMAAISESECKCSASEGYDDYILDGNASTHWHTMHGAVAEGTDPEKRWVGVSLNEATEIYGIRFLPRSGGGNGQVSEYKIQYRTADDGEWIDVASGTWDTSDGSWKYVGFPSVTAKQVRIVGVHTVSNGATDRHMTCAEFRVVGKSTGTSVVIPTDVIPVSEMIVTAGDSQPGEGPELAIDEDETTIWHTDWKYGPNHDNHWFQIELKDIYKVNGFRYLPRQSSNNGIITAYEIYTSLDGTTWTKAAEGNWDKNTEWKTASFDAVDAKYVKLVTIDALSDQSIVFASAAEIRLTGTKEGGSVTPPSTTEITVSIDNAYAKAGEALTVTVEGSENVSYSWKVDDKQVSTEASYVPTESDLESWIEVTVSDGSAQASAKMYFSKLPVVYIDTEGGQAIVSKENYIDATIKLQGNDEFCEDGVLYEGATEIRGRGNSTWGQPKKPYRLKLDKKTNAFGMGKSKHWVLLANYLDESLLRNTLAYDLSGEMGMEHLSTVWVDVILNGEYVGNYQFCENIRVDDTRIDIFDWESFAEDTASVIAEAEGMDDDTAGDLEGYMAEESMQWITDGSFTFNGTVYNLSKYETELLNLLKDDYGHTLEKIEDLDSLINGGYILELDEYYDEVSKFKTNSNQPIMFKNPEFVATNSDMLSYVKNYVQAFEDAVQSEYYTASYEGKNVHYSELYDFDALVDYWLITEIFFNEEMNKKSTYMYKEVDELMKMGPIWDMDWAAGAPNTSTGSTDQWATNYFRLNAQANQWYKDLVQDPYFLMRAQERYWEVRNVQVQEMLDLIDVYHVYLAESGEADGVRWGKGEQSFENDLNRLQTWLNTHITWMDAQMATEDSFDASFLDKDTSLALSISDAYGSTFESDAAEKAPADVFAPSGMELCLMISGAAGKAHVYINGKEYTVLETSAETTVQNIEASALNAAAGSKNVIEVKVFDANNGLTAANYITVKTDEMVDRSLLKKYIEDAEGIDLSIYTDESANALLEVLTEAKTVYENEAATQKEVNIAASNLDEAIKALEEKTEEPPVVETNEIIRISGKTRYETGYKVADELKAVLGLEKFDAVVIATGKNFADALAGSYLAAEKNAPILLTNGKADNIAALHDYIKANVVDGGNVYLLGGEAAVPAEVEAIAGYNVVRLSGKTRYETNLAILAEAGVNGNELIVATGKTFADSLSASASKLPILLVKPGTELNTKQKMIAASAAGGKIYIIGGTGAVSEEVAEELAAYAEVVRVSGKTRYETSVAVAKTFFTDIEKAVTANGKNFPDGLCGGPLAAALNAPLILTADGKTGAAVDYMTENAVDAGVVLGGTGALSDQSVVDMFALESADEIIVK